MNSNCLSSTIEAFCLKKDCTKLEYCKDKLYHVISKYYVVDQKEYVMEIICCLDEQLELSRQENSSLILKYLGKHDDFYVDVLTGAYNRRFYEEKINNTELIVPVVGGFSAGKSTLINQFLGENILSTALTPETALATELRYSENSYIKAIKKDDTFDKYEISEIDIIKEKAPLWHEIEIEPEHFILKGFDAYIKLVTLNHLNQQFDRF